MVFSPWQLFLSGGLIPPDKRAARSSSSIFLIPAPHCPDCRGVQLPGI
jgi:hypothetical protein